MELDKRNKRVVITDVRVQERDRLKKLKKQECGAAESGSAAVGPDMGAVSPTEDEVEEFFAILRRMKEAEKYFGEKGTGGKEWRREALEQAEDVDAIGDDGGIEVAKNIEEEMVDRGWDLNVAAPEAADSGGVESG